MDRLEFVDTHVHFWDLTHPDLNYSWLQPDSVHPQLREQLDRLKGKNYVVDDFIAETRGANVTTAVHVQAAVGIEDPVKETEWLQQAADRTGFPQAIVAYSNLKDPRVEDELARHRGYPNVRGIRDFSEGDYLVDPDFHRGYALLERFDLVAGFDVKWENMAKMRDLAGKFPNVRAVLDHCGFPEERTDEYFESWRKGISTLAEAENVVCKISGLGMCDWSWTVDSIRPWILHCIDAFGPKRCIFASNWPVDKLFSTYDVLIDAYTEIVAGFSPDEKTAMLSGNAKELYRLSRIHRWTGMDGVRTAEGGEGVTGAMIRARIWVDGRLAGGLQALLGAPMAAYSGCGEPDGGIGHGKRRSRTGLTRDCRTLGWLVGQWRTGSVRLGVEWLAVGPGRG